MNRDHCNQEILLDLKYFFLVTFLYKKVRRQAAMKQRPFRNSPDSNEAQRAEWIAGRVVMSGDRSASLLQFSRPAILLLHIFFKNKIHGHANENDDESVHT